MHPEVKRLIEVCAVDLAPWIREPIVEIGARWADGQGDYADLRPFFPGKRYIGVDLQAGPGVDVILERHPNCIRLALLDSDNQPATVLSVSTLEHDRDPWNTVQQVSRVIHKDGLVIATAPFHWPLHRHPADYWRFSPEAMLLLFAAFDQRVAVWNEPADKPQDVALLALGVDGSDPAFIPAAKRAAARAGFPYWCTPEDDGCLPPRA